MFLSNFSSNKTLGPSQGSALTWNIRMKIALDIARYAHNANAFLDIVFINCNILDVDKSIVLSLSRGLEYLHERCNPPVIHRDLKSSNILLDSNFNAKVRSMLILYC